MLLDRVARPTVTTREYFAFWRALAELAPARCVQRLARKSTGTTTGTDVEAAKVAAGRDAQRREKPAVERAGDRGRTGDVQLGKLLRPLRGKGFSAAVAETG